ncbi:type II toxin-antitoxin system RelE/ParE family toxin [Chromobacterium haemolyticum]|uniref:Type II toxin-antitoxin system RelE/ParE family toxin n=1 Tax=Chromobacterium fluminis TaxID=3044269 RepID=A0ABX0KY79_9NEIS|nr:type II toxin-antitoxin system RelE/ParE family toxin [Chromobacterium haemolyticum]NHR04450.1 type II toxin-antitoxin system RelE/ParE family toxin [Chromobacterium haemolyticum]
MLIWKPLALADRNAILDYIAQDNPVAAVEMDERIEGCAEQLINQPQLGRRGRVAGTRERVAHPSYLLIYEVDDAGYITVLRVLHTAQSWPQTRKRDE